ATSPTSARATRPRSVRATRRTPICSRTTSPASRPTPISRRTTTRWRLWTRSYPPLRHRQGPRRSPPGLALTVQPRRDKRGTMTQPANTAILELIDHASRIAQAQDRGDLTDRLARARSRLQDPQIRVVIAGQLKQGKSQLLNSLLNMPVARVGDDESTV